MSSEKNAMSSNHEKINYIEFAVADLDQTKAFFAEVFDWKFTDYGNNYCAFSNAGIDGGFYRSDTHKATVSDNILVVFYSSNLAQTQLKIEQADGKITENTFSFPGGRRFHFSDPSGNEFAVWSDQP